MVRAGRCYLRRIRMKLRFALRMMAVLTGLFFAACNKLPKETSSGKNTFGCRVDGKVWNTYTETSLDNAIEPDYDAGYFTVTAERDTRKNGGRIYLQLADSTGLRTRTYNGAAEGFYATYFRDEDGTTQIFQTAASGGGASIALTRVTPPATASGKAIVSGTFSFTATDASTGETVKVTDGRFDVEAR